jgi:hypothetical protein
MTTGEVVGLVDGWEQEGFGIVSPVEIRSQTSLYFFPSLLSSLSVLSAIQIPISHSFRRPASLPSRSHPRPTPQALLLQ